MRPQLWLLFFAFASDRESRPTSLFVSIQSALTTFLAAVQLFENKLKFEISDILRLGSGVCVGADGGGLVWSLLTPEENERHLENDLALF
jgi:hypothetical protein